MSCDGRQIFTFDSNENTVQDDRHSPTALDETHSLPAKNRPHNLTIPRQGSLDHTRYEQIWRKTSDSQTISDLPYHIREDVKELLNSRKESRHDWRGVASRMEVKPSTIKIIEEKDEFKKDPTEKLFNEISNEKITRLLQILYQMDRHDVLNIFYKDLYGKLDLPAGEKREMFSSSKFPSQESTPNSATSSTSGYLTTPNSATKDLGTPESAERSDSGMGSVRSQTTQQSRKTSGCFAKQNTEEALSVQPRTNFHSEESTKFWQKIPPKPDSTRKEWKQLEAALKRDFSKESAQSQVMRFICYVLKVEPYEQRHTMFVHDHDFANLVAWFGPVKKGEDGLFHKIGELIKQSTTYKGSTGPHSFFAGYMTKDEADRVITAAEKVGTFLIRFSSSEADKGSFAVCLKTDTGAEHKLLEGNPQTGKISYKGKEYSDLIKLYRHSLSRGGVSDDERTSCTTTCPDLPLNSMMKPYGAGARPAQGVGRGRGRGSRSQEQ